jgi:hypothetical protein
LLVLGVIARLPSPSDGSVPSADGSSGKPQSTAPGSTVVTVVTSWEDFTKYSKSEIEQSKPAIRFCWKTSIPLTAHV